MRHHHLHIILVWLLIAATSTNIKVKAGDNGGGAERTIALNLCNNCVKKFQEDFLP
jgi:hypothetical protein